MLNDQTGKDKKIPEFGPEDEDYISEEYCAHDLDEFAALPDDEVAIMASGGDPAAIEFY